MTGFNKVILMGNCVREPELRYTPSGTAVTDFRLAVNRVFGSGENRKQETLFIDIQAWGKSAETLNRYLQKGAPILVEGRLVLDQWTVNEERRSKIKVVAENFQFIPTGRSNSQGQGSQGYSHDNRPSRDSGQSQGRRDESFNRPPIDDEDVPF